MLLFTVLSGFFAAVPVFLLVPRFRRYIGWVLAALPVGLTAYFFALLFTQGDMQAATSVYQWVPNLGLDIQLRADGLSLLFALIVSGIGALIFIYAGGYLEEGQTPFFTWLFIFMAAMLGVVLADNLLLLYVFWELTSLSSFFLIGFEHERSKARDAALQALLVTSAGGLAMLGGFVLLGQTAGTYQISALLEQGEMIRSSPNYIPILILILLGAFTKSAQFPFHFWLPNAMEAPTPVSAYLHSATMVKAGIYLLARFHIVLGGTEIWLYVLSIVGAITMLIGAYLALNKTDLKQILAYSTISALGTMVLLLGLEYSGAVQAAIVFLLAHAMYKGALFMLAGSIQHETGARDVNELGGLRRYMPVTMIVTGLAGLSLAGFGPVLGFIGKELLFESVLESEQTRFFFTPAAVLAGAVNVAVALILFIRPFFGNFQPTPKKPHRAPLSLWFGPALLAGLGIIAGLIPALTGESIISPAVTSILGKPSEVQLALWHGLNPALGLSALAIVLGTLAYLGWKYWRKWTTPLEKLSVIGPEKWYLVFIQVMNTSASAITKFLQSGNLRYYLLTIIISMLVLSGYTIVQGQGIHWPEELTEIRFYEAALAAIVLIAAAVAVRTTSRLTAIAALGIVGYGIALIFLLFSAPDLAMTQFLIESLTVILFVLAFYHLPQFSQLTSNKNRILHAFISLIFGSMMSVLVLSAVGISIYPKISEYFLENAYTLAHGRDIVNVILVDFRGIDTLGEITVLGIAAVGAFALLKLRKETQTNEAGQTQETDRYEEYQESLEEDMQ